MRYTDFSSSTIISKVNNSKERKIKMLKVKEVIEVIAVIVLIVILDVIGMMTYSSADCYGPLEINCYDMQDMQAAASDHTHYLWSVENAIYDRLEGSDLPVIVAESWEIANRSELLENRQNNHILIEHCTVTVQGKNEYGSMYGFDEIGQYINFGSTNIGNSIFAGQIVDVWFIYDNTNDTDGIVDRLDYIWLGGVR